jgi:hypothetical protein
MGTFMGHVFRELGDRRHDRAFMVDYFQRHTEAVKAAFPPERLLVYEVKQGWEPLCAFLGVPVPDHPFPRENSREEFKARFGGGPPTPERVQAMLDRKG